MNYENSLAFARKADEQDTLRSFRQQFHIPKHDGKESIYFTGNSLGLQPRATREAVLNELEDWAKLGVEGHFKAANPWFSYHELFPSLLAPIIGGNKEEIVVMNGLTVNIHLLLASFYRPTKERYKILCEAKAFPSDQYAIESTLRLHGLDPYDALIEVPFDEEKQGVDESLLLQMIREAGESLALVMIGGVNYYSGQVFNMRAITEAAHAVGAYAGFDLAHAAGNVPLQLHNWGVDFACWCSYKYLNSGPGAVAGVFIHQQHVTNTSLPRMAGWWGYEKETRFKMQPGFQPIPTAEGWQLSNAPVLSMAAHKAALQLFAEAGMKTLQQKSRALTGYLRYLLQGINNKLKNEAIRIITPSSEGAYGCQISLVLHQQGRAVFDELTKRGVVADWREPNVIRVAPVPLYNSFEDVWHFASIIEEVLQQKS